MFTTWLGNFIRAFRIAKMQNVLEGRKYSVNKNSFDKADRVNWQQGRCIRWIWQTQHTTRFRFLFRFRSRSSSRTYSHFYINFNFSLRWQATPTWTRHVLKCWKTCDNLMLLVMWQLLFKQNSTESVIKWITYSAIS